MAQPEPGLFQVGFLCLPTIFHIPNPLGTRAMPLNASGVLIHGTPSPWSVGQSVSHGCVRMYMKDVEQLFDMVEVNTPVYAIRSSGDAGFDVTKKPFWQK